MDGSPALAALVVDGEARIADQSLDLWDLADFPKKIQRGVMHFPHGGNVLAMTMR